MPRKRTKDAVQILHRRYFEDRPKRLMELQEARENAAIARKIYELRSQAGMTQRQLAKRVGTTRDGGATLRGAYAPMR